MATFIMLTRLNHEGLKSPGSLAELSHEVMEQIRKNCPGVVWKASYVVLGPADYLDISMSLFYRGYGDFVLY